MRTGRLLLLGGLCGVLLAVAGAVALRLLEEPQARGAHGHAAAAPARGTTSRPLTAPALRPAQPRRGAKAVGRSRVVARAADPDGGPGWVLRVTRLRMTWREPNGRVLLRPVNVCAQLLRRWRGQLGWIDGRNRFRPVSPVSDAAPEECGPPNAPTPWAAPDSYTTRISDPPAGGEPQALQTIHWSGPYAGDRAMLKVGSRAQERAARAEYRVADPAGGLPWGFPSEGQGPRGCIHSFAPLVGGRAGIVDERLDTLSALNWGGAACANNLGEGDPTPQRPLRAFASSSASAWLSSGEPARTRALRLADGRTMLVAEAHPDVVSVTVLSPRDVRTLTPSPRDHLVAALWDGVFTTGDVVLRARMRDGTTREQRVPVFRS
ncbi:hypothetical protein Q7L71_20030 [Conexibacter sp. CPCC 205706]|nr:MULTISPECIES: hypothetical protein [unclassified Conexibacter]MDO8187904.1 hypothetical protein [Conexibacter sp. CPCC 205706]MDO8198645.1 hypothetical protein [Conexibacter sp. CPCC 205762]